MPFVSPLNTTDMAKDLVFHATMTVTEFKSAMGIDTIEIVKSPKTDKLFMAKPSGEAIGAVHPEYKEGPVVSEVSGADGVRFFLLHKKGGNNTIDSL
jgi:hypothetical protein